MSGACSLWAGDTWSHHVWLEQETFDQEVLIEKLTHDRSKDFLGDCSANVDTMLSILKNLWLDDGHQTILLADGAIPGELLGILLNRCLGWEAFADLEDCSPFGKPAAELVVLCTSLAQAIKALSQSLIVCTRDWYKTSVHLDTTVDSSTSEHFGELHASFGCVSHCLVEHDHSADVLAEAWSREEQLPVGLAVCMIVFHLDLVKPLANCAC